ncbi:esterase B1-like [Musca vetustissima]|uniref:esterase B1-like n=1 Tax=Musca vetustissima TaxID=27455 RepID=UPI002AB68B05|nr:esterase B1-like [Musca vetustissima]
MELNLGLIQKLKLLGKFLKHQFEQYQLATKEYEIIQTSYGPIRGCKFNNLYHEYGQYYSFEGIPFAQPPLGELRFRAPKPPEPWKELLDCTRCRSKPIQYDYVTKSVQGSEDCLYLNVYTEKLKSEKPLPVMVWIYGGGFHFGEATRTYYSPDYFMSKDVILVTFNYRLGIFGFLSFDDPNLNIPGNAGIKDQVLALKWIKENIHSFNGDPNNITIFGQSAGASSAHMLTLTEQTRGLFHKVILQSGSVYCKWAYTTNRNLAYKNALHLGYKGPQNDKEIYEFFNKKYPKDLVVADLNVLTKDDLFNWETLNYMPVVEPYDTPDCIATKPYEELVETSWGNKIPFIVGTTSLEGLLYTSLLKKYPFLIDEVSDFVNLLPDKVKTSHNYMNLKEMGLKLKETYFNGHKPNAKEHFNQFLELLSHKMFLHDSWRTIKDRRRYAKNATTYYYSFNFDSEFFNHFRITCCGASLRGVCHADELSYFFYGTVPDKLDMECKEYRCLEQMIGMWYSFALKSEPNCDEIKEVTWQPVDDFKKAPKCLIIDDHLECKEMPAFDTLKIWDAFYDK